jgi:hypothetical protein
MTDPDKTPLPVAGPSETLDPAAMAAAENKCCSLRAIDGLQIYGHYRTNLSLSVNMVAGSSGRCRSDTDLTPDEARQLAKVLIEVANAVDAAAEILAARESDEQESANA